MKKLVILSLFAALFITQTANAHCTKKKFYAGGGLLLNSVSGYDSSAGFQMMAGYCLNLKLGDPRVKASAELGYMNSGDFERTHQRGNGTIATQSVSYDGLWLSAVGEYKFTPRYHMLGRLGLDAGDDNGILVGAGAAMNLTSFAQVRGEYIIRDNVSSVQINFITEF